MVAVEGKKLVGTSDFDYNNRKDVLQIASIFTASS